jgi:hypothetical protein
MHAKLIGVLQVRCSDAEALIRVRIGDDSTGTIFLCDDRDSWVAFQL